MTKFKPENVVSPQVVKLKERFENLISQLELKSGEEHKSKKIDSQFTIGLSDTSQYARIDAYELETAIDDLVLTLRKLKNLCK